MMSQLDGFSNNIKDAIKYKVPSFNNVTSICLCGIGGSAMSGDIILDYLAPICDRNVTVIRGVSLPKWVKGGALVVVISYSGNTKEALDIFNDSLAKGLMMVCISSGGELIDRAKAKNVPVHPRATRQAATGRSRLSARLCRGGHGIGGRL